MRRATMRMTFESSTIRQLFITRTSGPVSASPAPYLTSGRLGAPHGQQARHFENDQQLALQAVDAARDIAPARIEGRGITLVGLGRQAHDLADGVDDQAVELALVVDDHTH